MPAGDLPASFPGRMFGATPIDARMTFRRVMIVVTLLMWAILYLLFTLRAFAMQRPLLTEQALCRLAMMPVGLFTCTCLYFVGVRAARLKKWQAGFWLLAAIAVAAVFYSTVNYVVFYVIADYWVSQYSAGRKIWLDSLDFMWIFSTWLALFYLIRTRFRPAAPTASEAGGGYLSEIWVKHRESRVRIDLKDVSRFAAEGDYVRIHVNGSSYLLRSTTTQMEQKLDPAQFVRIHRRMIVSLSRLKRVSRRADGRVTVALDNDLELPVGRAYLRRLRRLTRQQAAVEETESARRLAGLRPAGRAR